MANYLAQIAGRIKEVAALVTSSGATDSGKLIALNSAGKVDITMMPSGVGAATKSVLASEALAAGALVNVYDNAATLNARNADATAEGKEANGYVLSAVANAANATVYFSGTISGLTGLTDGARYYLATTAGSATATAPSTSGNVVQYVGTTLSTTELEFRPAQPITLA